MVTSQGFLVDHERLLGIIRKIAEERQGKEEGEKGLLHALSC